MSINFKKISSLRLKMYCLSTSVATLLLGACASYVVTGNSGGPDVGGAPSPDGRLRAHVTIAKPDKATAMPDTRVGLCPMQKVQVLLAEHSVSQNKTLSKKTFELRACEMSWRVTWRDAKVAEFEFFESDGRSAKSAYGVDKVSGRTEKTLLLETLSDDGK